MSQLAKEISVAEAALQAAWHRGDGQEAQRLQTQLNQLWHARRAELAQEAARANAGAWPARRRLR